MKPSTLALFLVASLAASAAGSNPTASRSHVLPSKIHGEIVSANHEADKQTSSPASDEDLCYTMRVYMFEAKDGESPRPKGIETCVASSPRILHKTAEPEARFKLLK